MTYFVKGRGGRTQLSLKCRRKLGPSSRFARKLKNAKSSPAVEGSEDERSDAGKHSATTDLYEPFDHEEQCQDGAGYTKPQKKGAALGHGLSSFAHDVLPARVLKA